MNEQWSRLDSSARRVMTTIALGLVGLLIGVAIAGVGADRYESSVRLLVGPIAAQRSTLDASGLLSTTYADLLTSGVVVDRASASLGVDLDPADVSALPNQQSRVILVTVRSTDADRVQEAADTLAAVLIDLVAVRETTDDAQSDPGGVTVLDPATEPVQSRNVDRLIILISIAAVPGGGLVLERLRADRRRRREPLVMFDVSDMTDVPVVVAGASIVVPTAEGTNWTELGRRLGSAGRDGSSDRSLVFVPMYDDPVFVDILLELALAWSRVGYEVILADADAACASIADRVENVPTSAVGRTTSRSSDHLVTDATGASVGAPMRLVAAGAADVADSGADVVRLRDLIDSAPAGSLVMALTPPTGSSRVVLPAAAMADRVVLMVREHGSPRREVASAVEALRWATDAQVAVLAVDDEMPAIGVSLQSGAHS